MKVARHRIAAVIIGGALLLGTGNARAQTNIAGPLSDSTTGPLTAGVYHATSSIWVPGGQVLTIQAGAMVKFQANSTFNIDGTLIVNGTGASPALFTSIEDDTAGGDTNGNGPSSGSPGDWGGLLFTGASDASVVVHADVRYSGALGYTAFRLGGADITLSYCTARDSSLQGMDLLATSFPTVSNCAFVDNAGVAVGNTGLPAVAGFTNNTASGNAGGDCIEVNQTFLSADLMLIEDNCLGGALAMKGSLFVNAGVTLTLEPGVVMKFQLGQLTVNGTVHANGTAAKPVVFTDFEDDDYAGDTNGDGPSTGTPGSWGGLLISSTSDGSTFDHTVSRFGGAGGLACFYVSSANVTMENSLASDSSTSGMFVADHARPIVRNCSFENNAQHAVGNAGLAAMPGFSFNSAANNGVGDYIRVSSFTSAEDLTIEPHNLLGGVLVVDLSGAIFTPSTATLTAGVVVKVLGASTRWDVQGSLNLLGTESNPVVITTILDDSVGGDTNKDGTATTATPGSWRGLYFFSISDASLLRNVVVRYPGASMADGVLCFAPGVTLDEVRVEHSLWDGFDLGDLTRATRLVAWNCGRDGVVLSNGSFDPTHLSAVGNGQYGIARSSHTGTVVNSIAWANGTGNYSGFPMGTLTYSDGDATLAGSNGNIDVDPLFVDQPNGDLRLSAGSLCVDAGDPLEQQGSDCTLPDMGAYESDPAGDAPSIYCTAKVNSEGCTPYVDFVGFPSATGTGPFVVTANDVLNNKSGIFFYGVNGPHNGPFQGGIKCVKSPVRRTPVQNSGGNNPPNDCSGTFAYDMNTRIQSGADPNLVPGVEVHGQFWMRDPFALFTTGLTDAIRFRVCP